MGIKSNENLDTNKICILDIIFEIPRKLGTVW